MRSFFYAIILIILMAAMALIYIKRLTNQSIKEGLNILDGLKKRKQLNLSTDVLTEEYKTTLNSFIKQDNELDNSLEELKEFRNELEITYNSLITKTSQLEYSNNILKRRVHNLYSLNNLSRNVLSIFDLDKIVDIILDAYFILTAAKRMTIYLWEDNVLVNKKVKGALKFRENLEVDVEKFKNFSSKDYVNLYNEFSSNFIVLSDEEIIVTPLVINEIELGVIYIIENKVNLLELEREMISALSIQASIAIYNSFNHERLIVNERISGELELASNMQKRILPESINKLDGLEIITYFEPAKEIGGDYYDYFIRNNIFSINIADVSGKGVPAAFLMALSRSVLKTVYNITTEGPAQELNLFNQIIYEDISEDMFITMMNTKYDMSTRKFTISNAGHNPLIIYRKSTDILETISVKGVAIGFLKDYKYKEKEIFLEEGDIVFMYTDGVIEAESENKELFGIERLKEVILENKNKNLEEIKIAVLNSIDKFVGNNEQVDDITFVIMKCINKE